MHPESLKQMSRRKTQQIRAIQRATGATFRQASNVHAQAVAAIGGGGVDGPGRPGSLGSTGGGRGSGDGWPLAPRDLVVGSVISAVRGFVGNALPQEIVPALCEYLSLTNESAPVEVMVTKVVAGPVEFPYLESALVREYDYELELHEVGVGFDADIELVGLPSAVAARFGGGGTGRVIDDDGTWATVAMDALELSISALVRYEFESTDIQDLTVTLRED